MTYRQSIEFYHSLTRFGVRPGLESTRKLLARLGDPQDGLVCIHVAGTNGKGSVCTELSCILRHAGYKTGLYMSPYITEFGERIQTEGKIIPPERLCAVTEKVKAAVEALADEGVEITEFEAVTAAGFLYFAEEKCDRVVLETGLGGRLDATNVIRSCALSVIVSVSVDHTKVLGETIPEIAFEKCGIIKPRCPVVTNSRQHPEALPVIERTAEERNCRLIIADTDKAEIVSETIRGTEFVYGGDRYFTPFPGGHQVENAVTAIEAAKELGIAYPQIAEGIGMSVNPARTEIVSEQPLIILDGSHNDGSTKALADVLGKHLSGKKLLAVMGMMADKEVSKAVSNLAPLFDTVVAVKPTNPRSMDPGELCGILSGHGVKDVDGGAAADGIKTALGMLGNYDALVVCGSLYLAGDVRPLLTSLK